MIIDKNGKLFGKLSIIDLFFILIVVVAIVGVGYKYTRSSTTPFAEKDKMQIVIAATDVELFAEDSINIGSTVKDWKSNAVLGTLVDYKIREYYVEGFNNEGEVVLSARPDRITIELIVEGEGVFSELGTSSFGGVNYYVNRSMELTCGDVVLWARIEKISKLD